MNNLTGVLSRASKAFCSRSFSVSNKMNAKVTLVGASGGIGQPLALLLKHNPMILNLNLMDIKDPAGLAMDISHIDTKATVTVSNMTKAMENPYKGSDIIVITAGLPRKPGMTRDDLFAVNAKIVYDILSTVNELNVLPKIAIITNPVNSILPMAFELLKTKFDVSSIATRLFGVTTLDCVRASTFYAQHLGKDPREVIVPVVGGHSDTTICPLFSLSNFPVKDEAVIEKLIKLIREAGTRVVEAKGGAGSATLSMAYAGNRFVNSLLEAHYGKHPTECTFIYSNAHSNFGFYAEMVRLNAGGVEAILPIERASSYDLNMLEKIVPQLTADINKGIAFAKTQMSKGSSS